MVGQHFLGAKNIFELNTICVPKHLCPQKMRVKQNLGQTKMWVLKNDGSQKIRLKTFVGKNNIGFKQIWFQNLFKSNIFWNFIVVSKMLFRKQ